MYSGYLDTLASSLVVAAQLMSSNLDVDPSRLNVQEAYCLAQNVWFESRSKSKEDKIAVAQTTINRVKYSRYPDSICEVVFADRQFSWTHDGISDVPKLDTSIRRAAWTEVVEVTILTYFGIADDIVDGASHYHAHYASPIWRHDMIKTTKTDGHRFYRLETETQVAALPIPVIPQFKPDVHTVELETESVPGVFMALLGWIFDKVVG